jgi:FkbM family methyltransferase
MPRSMQYEIARAVCSVLPPLVAQRVREMIFPRSKAYQSASEFSTRSVTGSEFRGRLNDFHEYPFAVHGYFGWRHIAVAHAVCPPGSTIVEAGANVGTETIAFLDIVGPQGRVHAFEPDPLLVARLRSNLAAVNTDPLIVHNMALSADVGEADFVSTSDTTASGGGHIVAEVTAGVFKVPMNRLDNVTTDDNLSAIFMDVEGAELRVLRGAEKLLAAQRPVIVLEASEALQARLGGSLAALRAFLDQHRYVPFEIGGWGLRDLHPEPPPVSDWVCLPAEKAALLRRKIHRAILLAGVLPPLRHLSPLTRANVARAVTT